MVSDKVKALSQQARQLSPQERIALLEDILDSLDRPDPALDGMWAREARDRLAGYRRGEMSSKDLDDVIAKYRR